MTTAQPLPENVKDLHRLVHGLHREIEHNGEQLQQKNKQLDHKQQRIELLEESLRLERLRRFGAQSEKHIGQRELFDEAETECESGGETQAVSGVDLEVQPDGRTTAPGKGVKKGRKPLPKELPCIDIVHELEGADKHCSCGKELQVISQVESEQLDIIPAKARRIRHIRKVYSCKACDNEPAIKTAPLPPQPLPKSNASAGLLAYLVVSKYIDALPLYRIEKQFQRINVHLPRQTQAGWIIRLNELVTPLLALYRQQLLSHPLIQMDETTVQVLKEKDRSPSSQSWMWVQRGGPPGKPIVLFDYDTSRGGQVPERLLDNFTGTLQCDGYSAYKAFARNRSVTLQGCFAHARRKFTDAIKANADKTGKITKAHMAVGFIAKLYAVEKKVRGKSSDEIYQARQTESLPILNKLRKWLDTQLANPSHGKMAQALTYLHNQWEYLIVYCNDGSFYIDNNFTEQAIRPFTIGRKNWMFSDTVKGANASAAMYSLAATAKANGLNPYLYFRVLFTELPTAKCDEKLQKLLPWNMNNAELEKEFTES